MSNVKKLRSDEAYQLKITLKQVKPPVWRRILVPADMKLNDLHKVFQTTMGWTNSHLHAFRIGSAVYSVPHRGDYTPVSDSRKARLNALVKKPKQKFFYEYDFGDGWEHEIVLEKILPEGSTAKLPVCVAGKRHCPPEDCGGPWGYESLLETLKDPDHDEYEETMEWLGGEFDPEMLDIDEINEMLREKDFGCFIIDF
ncbi:MAG: plasmid pRiA4b ORF-3 family protein [Spirochaetes bacterium]|nr:MAG: plasmid pRiA4b ORF-3 family protein [Spirochaetota bacterium]